MKQGRFSFIISFYEAVYKFSGMFLLLKLVVSHATFPNICLFSLSQPTVCSAGYFSLVMDVFTSVQRPDWDLNICIRGGCLWTAQNTRNSSSTFVPYTNLKSVKCLFLWSGKTSSRSAAIAWRFSKAVAQNTSNATKLQNYFEGGTHKNLCFFRLLL